MTSKAEADDGRVKGVSFTKPKAGRYHKRRQGHKIKRFPTSARPNFVRLTGDMKGRIYDVGTCS